MAVQTSHAGAMRLLVLGGTEFVGAALVDEALARGWEVTTFNRGTKPVPGGVRRIIGDRREGITIDGEWDVVADTWSQEPSVVRASSHHLAGMAERYVYVSSRSVHSHPTASGADEGAPTVDAASDDTSYDDYQRAKRGGELAVLEAFGDSAVIVRPGLILGPRENIGRLPYWLNRAARGGSILAPGPADGTFQYIDARDLATFALSGLEPGAYSVVNRPGAATIGELLELTLEVTGSTGTLRWADPAWLLAQNVEPWMQLPVWLPEGEDHETMHEADVSKAFAAGLRVRPLRDTVESTWEWLRAIHGEAPRRPGVGLDPEREHQLITALIPI